MTDFQHFSNRVTLNFSFQCIDLHQNPLTLTSNQKNLYTKGAVRLKRLPLYYRKLMVNTFGTIGSILAIICIAFRGVAPCNLVY